MRIEEMETVLTLVDGLPRERQLRIVKKINDCVEDWEDQASMGVDDLEYSKEKVRRIARECNFDLPPDF
jgi:hypothetical protein